MKILFLMLSCPDLNSDSTDMYSDLALEFSKKGHDLTIITLETGLFSTKIYIEKSIKVLRVRAINSQGNISFLKKGMAYALMPFFFKSAYSRFLKNETFDLVVGSAPPITLVDFAAYVKKNTNAKYYLILRDIHPQSFHGVGYFRWLPIVYWFFYWKAQKAYKLADYIGCMSPANIKFVRSIAPQIDEDKIVLLPNWQKHEEYISTNISMREKYGLQDKFIAIYGGNLASGQGLENIISLAKHYKNVEDILFLIVGKGIKKQFLIDEVNKNNLINIKFLDFMPRDEYNDLMKSSDVGIISLNKKYTVPTCPSRIIGYMSMKIPVIAIINKNSDYGQYYIDQSGCGFWSDDINDTKLFDNFDNLYKDRKLRLKMGFTGYKYYTDNLTSEMAYNNIIKQIK